MEKYGTQQKKVFWARDLLRKGHGFQGQATYCAVYKGQKNFFCINMELWVPEFIVDFKNINLTKYTLKGP
jgi:hypothetical protein